MSEILQVTNELIALWPDGIAFAGGEPLTVPGLCEIADRVTAAGIPVALYTSGWNLDEPRARQVARAFTHISVSVDGATADVHDRLRGRTGSFEWAMRALTLLDAHCRDKNCRDRTSPGRGPARLGIDCVVTRSAFAGLAGFCTGIAPRFRSLRSLTFCAAMPADLAARAGFAEPELLTEGQLRALGDGTEARRLRKLAPETVTVTITGNGASPAYPDVAGQGTALRAMPVEPDGVVRAMAVYEGAGGILLEEPAAELWARSVATWADPFVTETLGRVRTVNDWAEAARQLDHHLGAARVRARIGRRPPYPLAATA